MTDKLKQAAQQAIATLYAWAPTAPAVKRMRREAISALDEAMAEPVAAPAYKDSTPELHVGDSAFESWYSTYNPAHKGDKQRARDAYAAGMGDPLVTAAPQPAPVQDYPPLPDFDTVEQHIYGACRRYITQDMLEPIHNLIREAVDADRAARTPADSVTAPAGGAAVPDDWPTDAMIEAGRKVAATHGRLLGSGQSLWHVFREMFAAAPTPPAQPAPPQEPVYAFRRKGLDDFCTCTEKRYAELSAKPNLFETRIFYTAPQTSPASQGDALDAARYRYLRDVPMDQWPAELLTAIRLQQNAKWDTNIDAARAAHQEGEAP